MMKISSFGIVVDASLEQVAIDVGAAVSGQDFNDWVKH
jgi:hypothetical protein